MNSTNSNSDHNGKNICPNCQTVNKPGDKFCARCGTPLVQQQTQPQPRQQQSQQQQQPQQQSAPETTVPHARRSSVFVSTEAAGTDNKNPFQQSAPSAAVTPAAAPSAAASSTAASSTAAFSAVTPAATESGNPDASLKAMEQAFRSDIQEPAAGKKSEAVFSSVSAPAEESADAKKTSETAAAQSAKKPAFSTKSPRRTAVVCPKCGAVNQPGGKFCYKCGTNLTASKQAAPPADQGKASPKASPKVEEITVQYEEPQCVFAEGLPDWSIEPPKIMIHRKKKK